MPIARLALPLLALSRPVKRAVVLMLDVSLCFLKVWLAFYLRLGEFVALQGSAFLTACISVAIALPLFIVSGLYRAIIRCSGWPALMTASKATGAYGLFFPLWLRLSEFRAFRGRSG